MDGSQEKVARIRSALAAVYPEPLLRSADYLSAPRGRRLGHPLTPGKIDAFQRVNDVEVPREYVEFLLGVGDGGVGPGYGLNFLSEWVDLEIPSHLPVIRDFYGDGMDGVGIRLADRGGSDTTLLLVSGSYRGRLVDVNLEGFGSPPRLRPEKNFIEWYWNWVLSLDADAESRRFVRIRTEGELARVISESSDLDQVVAAVFEARALAEPSDDFVRLLGECALRNPKSQVRYQSVSTLSALGVAVSVDIFVQAVSDVKRAISRKALVQVMRFAGSTGRWQDALASVRATGDQITVSIANSLDSARVTGIPLRSGS